MSVCFRKCFRLFKYNCKLFILKAARYKLCITIVLYLIKFMSNLFIFLIFQKFMFRPLAFYLNFFHFTCSKSDAPSTSMQSKCIVNDYQGQPLKSNLSTSSLIRPYYTIRTTIFEKVFWLEKFPKTELISLFVTLFYAHLSLLFSPICSSFI